MTRYLLLTFLITTLGLSANEITRTDLTPDSRAKCAKGNSGSDQLKSQLMTEDHGYQGHPRYEGSMVPGYNAPGRTDLVGSSDWFLSASFIYWQSRPSNILIGSRDTITHEFTNPPGQRANVTNITYDYEFKPGFKVLIGASGNRDNWSGALEYTWFRSNVKDSASEPLPGHIETVWFSGDNSIATLASSNNAWKFKYNCIDGTLYRTYYTGLRLLLTPYSSVRGVYLKQNMNVDLVALPTLTTTFPTTVKSEATSWYLGPRGGLKIDWLFTNNFRMVGETALSLLFSHFRLTYKNYGNFTFLSDVLAVQNKTKFYQFTPNLDLNLGFGWGKYVNESRQHIDFVLRYDFLYFWDGSQLTPTSGNLTLQGLTATFKFDF